MDIRFCYFHCLVLVVVARYQNIYSSTKKTIDEDGLAWPGVLDVLGSVLSGPARGKSLVLHLDPDLPQDVKHEIMAVKAVRHTPHITMSLGVNNRWWPPVTSVLHIVIFLTHKPELLQSLWHHWKPTNLLLLSLMPGHDTSILSDDVFSGVERLGLITGGRQGPPRVYTLRPFSSPTPHFLAHWNNETFTHFHSLFIDRFSSFNGYNFQVASWINEPVYLNWEDSATGTKIPAGVSLELIGALSQALNFTFTLTEKPPNSKWGTNENGSWDGIMGMVQRREKNFTINGLYQSVARSADFDASTSWWEDGYSVALRKPQAIQDWMRIYHPFTLFVWGSLIICLASVFLIVNLQVKLTKSEPPNQEATSWLYFLRPLLNQSLTKVQQELAHRVLLSVWLFCCLVFSASYTCNLVAILTNPSYPSQIHTLHQLAGSPFRLGKVPYGGYYQEASHDPPSTVMTQLKEKRDWFDSEAQANRAMMEGSHGFIEVASSLALMPGEWYLVREKLYPASVVWYFPKHTPWKRKIDQGIRRLVEADLIRLWYQAVVRRDGGHKEGGGGGGGGTYQERSVVSLTLQHLQGLFITLMVIWLIILGVFLLELLHHRYNIAA